MAFRVVEAVASFANFAEHCFSHSISGSAVNGVFQPHRSRFKATEAKMFLSDLNTEQGIELLLLGANAEDAESFIKFVVSPKVFTERCQQRQIRRRSAHGVAHP